MTAAALLTLFSCAPPAADRSALEGAEERGVALETYGIELTEALRFHASDLTPGDYFGIGLSGVGDVDGDGYEDIVASSYHHNSYYGAAYLFYGSESGIDVDSEDKISGSSLGPVGYFGYAISGAGDINGDGYDDVVVGALQDGVAYSGKAYVYYGSSSGIDLSSEEDLLASDGDSYDQFGRSVAGAGDLDGDGYDDLIIGAYLDEDGGDYAGAAYVYYGSSAGMDTSRETKLVASDSNDRQYFGTAVAAAGDVDGDGYDDVIVGAPYDNELSTGAGASYVYFGSSTGISAASEVKLLPELSTTYQYAGTAVSGDIDVNGDGYDDVIVGAPIVSGSSGAVIVYYGSSAGPSTADTARVVASDSASAARFGNSIAGLGDSNGDGYDDFLVGAYGVNAGQGAAYLFYGSASGVVAADQDKLTASDAGAADYYGYTVGRAGDVNGDGRDDMLVGAVYDDDAGPDAGGVYVYAYQERDDDGDGIGVLTDCDDGDAAVGEPEEWYVDADGDGYGSSVETVESCDEPSGYVTTATDCDDSTADRFPGNTEVCDEIDNDCDDIVDEGVEGLSTWYEDADGDGFGDVSTEYIGCFPGEGWVEDATDCDDADADAYPGGAETCGDGVDSDCNGRGGPDDDEDGDGLSWTEEDDIGTDDCNNDTDGDGISDGYDDDPLTPALDEVVEESGGCGSKRSSALLLLLGGLALPRRRRG